MQANCNVEANESMLQAFYKIYSHEGLPGLWRVCMTIASNKQEQKQCFIISTETIIVKFIGSIVSS